MRSRSFLYTLLVVLILLDIYVFQALKTAVNISNNLGRYLLWGFYWLVAVLSWLGILMLPRLFENREGHFKYVIATAVLGLFIGKALTAIFLLIDDLRRGGTWIFSQFQKKETPGTTGGMTRSGFLSRVGLLAGGSFFGILMYGLSNKYNYKIHRLKLKFPNLPGSFDGLKILQLSDIHTGSFTDAQKVKGGILKALKLDPDIIFFTGDLVNNRSGEVTSVYKEIFGLLKAPMGVYSILGNHDYGDYVKWDSTEAKAANLQELKDIQASLGWEMLNNAHAVLERGGEKMGLVGVENWSAKKQFPTYGDTAKATSGLPDLPFNILLSHDPTHWDAEVRPKYPYFDLTLSGHTHGMQFGVEIPGFHWSPSQYMYPEWAGLYKKEKQYLYVNRGFGFIGYPGRVGILPEITLIELKKA